MEYYDLDTFKTEDDSRRIIQHFNSEFEKGKGFRWALELKSTAKLLEPAAITTGTGNISEQKSAMNSIPNSGSNPI